MKAFFVFLVILSLTWADSVIAIETKVQAPINVPALSAQAKQGMLVFNKFCIECHGANAAGSEDGPPLVHKIYEPGHHGDGSFYVAIRNGVRPHHWRFGAMPPIKDMPDSYIPFVIRYVRELQRANGIFSDLMKTCVSGRVRFHTERPQADCGLLRNSSPMNSTARCSLQNGHCLLKLL